MYDIVDEIPTEILCDECGGELTYEVIEAGVCEFYLCPICDA